MSAGTLTLTNNSAAVMGSGTAFTTELAAGDFAVVTVGGIPYTLPVKTVNSNTSLTLVSNFTGPTQSGAAWSAIPRIAMNLVTAAVVAQAAEALRGLNYDKQNWQQVFSGSGNITVRLPDGTSYPGPSWKYLSDNAATKTGGAVPVEQGGTGATNYQDAREKLGLGSSSTRDIGDTGDGVVTANKTRVAHAKSGPMVASNTASDFSNDFNKLPIGDVAIGLNAAGGMASGPGFSGQHWATVSAFGWGHKFLVDWIYSGSAVQLGTRFYNSNGGVSDWAIFYNNKNTTKASDGTLKAASPIVQVYGDGSFHLNDESEGCTVTRQTVGEYLIEGCMGLNADASWGGIDGGFDIPTDRNKQPRIWLDYTVNPDGSILIKTYHRVYATAPEFAQNRIGHTDINRIFTETVTDGEPVDIPADSFVSVRVEMPVNSIWNQKQKDLQEAMEKAEHECEQTQQGVQ
ncbi:phage tail protein [Citrobacter sp. wls830]|nr:phage tail protein [Citrobacter sp. wls830]